MTNRAKFYEFWKKFKLRIFYLSSHSFEIWTGDLLGRWMLPTNEKFQHNISKIMPARLKKHRDMGCE